MTKLTFKIEDDFAEVQAEYWTILRGDSLEHHVDAFRSFLLAIGFDQELVKEYLNVE